MFDWYRDEEDNESNINNVNNDKSKTPEGGEINLLDITPGKNNSNSRNKGHVVNISEKNESPKKNSKGKHASKKHDGSFSESGSESAGSSGDDKKAKKGLLLLK